MGVTLYYFPMSAPCRTVMLGAKSIGVELDLKLTNIMEGAHMTEEYLKMNPQHTIPSLDDDGIYMSESRAILQYLANKYAPDSALYPTDPQKRAVVDMRLMFDMGTLDHRFGEAYFPIIFRKQKADEEKMSKLNEALGWLDGYLAEGYSAGSEMTIADFPIMSTLSTMEAVGHDLEEFSAVVDYMAKCKEEMDGYDELNQQGADQFGAFAKSAMEQA